MMLSILVVEDDDVLREVLHEYLSEEHFCCAVSTAEEAMPHLERRRFELVMTDISMPGMSGLELLGQVKQRWAETVVVMLSGIHDEQYAQGLFKMGAFDYLAKPFTLEDVGRALERAIAAHQELWRKCAVGSEAAACEDEEDEREGTAETDDNAAIFSSVQLGGIFSLPELLEIVQRGRMNGYIELHWDKATIRQARQLGKFRDAATGELDGAVLNCAGWLYLREGLIIDAAIEEPEGSPNWREPEQALALLVKLATYVGRGVRAWGFSMKEMERAARLTVSDNSGKLFSIITSDEQEDAAYADEEAARADERVAHVDSEDGEESVLSELVFDKVGVDASFEVETQGSVLTL
jgi:CheY-like chemotaxis protein